MECESEIMKESFNIVENIVPVTKLLRDADHVDSKAFETHHNMEGFTERMVSYQPGWLKFLFKIRGVVASLLGLQHAEYVDEREKELSVDFNPGGKVDFFNSIFYEPDKYWIGEASDKHLACYIGVIADSGRDGNKIMHSLTIVKYKHWTGPLYFNLIRPFHHLIVYYMGKYAAK